MTSIPKFVLFSALFLVAGCGSSVPEATDEEIISFLGDSMGASSRNENAPLVIAGRTKECVEFLSGLNAEIVKDMPAEFLGMVKTECRERFNEIVKDEARNLKGFKLEHFENKNFASRILAAAEKSREIYDAYKLEEKKQRRIEAEEKLKAERAEFEQSLSNYELLVDEIIALCAETEKVKAALREKGNNFMGNQAPRLNCTHSKEEMLKAADENRAKWAAVEVSETMFGVDYHPPYINERGLGTVSGLKFIIEELQNNLAYFKKEL